MDRRGFFERLAAMIAGPSLIKVEIPSGVSQEFVEALALPLRRAAFTNQNMAPYEAMARHQLTDIYFSPEALEDTRNWQTLEVELSPLSKILEPKISSQSSLGVPYREDDTKLGYW